MSDWPDAPEGAMPWPERVPEPSWSSPPPALDVADGLYFRLGADGRLRLLASVRDGLLESWLLVSDGEGCFKSEGPPWFVQRYYADGRLEDFSRDDDTSEPYPAGQSFLDWTRGQWDRIASPPSPMPDWWVRNMEAYDAMKAGDRPPAHADRVVSGEVPEDLEALLPMFGDVRWHSPAQCYERLVHYHRWQPELARDFTNFAPVACASALMGSAPGTYLVPAWEGTPGAAHGALAEVEMYMRVRRAAGCEPWVRALAECLPWPFTRIGPLPSPIVWTIPPAGTPGFHRTRVCLELLLRQEASLGQELKQQLGRVDAERYMAAAALAGAFLQSPRATGDLGPDAELADLVASLSSSTVMGALGSWAIRQAGGGLEDEQTARRLGSFVNRRSDLLRECLEQLGRGEPFWPGGSQLPGWASTDPPAAGPQRDRAKEFLASAGLDLGPRCNRFLLRVQTAARFLLQGPWRSSGVESEMLADISRCLEDRPADGYRGWLAAAEWALWEEGEHKRLANALARMMLSAIL